MIKGTIGPIYINWVLHDALRIGDPTWNFDQEIQNTIGHEKQHVAGIKASVSALAQVLNVISESCAPDCEARKAMAKSIAALWLGLTDTAHIDHLWGFPGVPHGHPDVPREEWEDLPEPPRE